MHVYERFTDSAAATAHLNAFAEKFSMRFAPLIERRQFTVCGNPSSALRALLDRFGATQYLSFFAGFS